MAAKIDSLHVSYYQNISKKTALGDPLIKGLTEVANNRPTNPVKFLADYLHSIADKKKIVIFVLLHHFVLFLFGSFY